MLNSSCKYQGLIETIILGANNSLFPRQTDRGCPVFLPIRHIQAGVSKEKPKRCSIITIEQREQYMAQYIQSLLL